eukprot:5626203-Amphidinium_carterae.2
MCLHCSADAKLYAMVQQSPASSYKKLKPMHRQQQRKMIGATDWHYKEDRACGHPLSTCLRLHKVGTDNSPADLIWRQQIPTPRASTPRPRLHRAYLLQQQTSDPGSRSLGHVSTRTYEMKYNLVLLNLYNMDKKYKY